MNVVASKTKLDSIFKIHPAADDNVQLTWRICSFWGNPTNEVTWVKNGARIGSSFQEHGGGWWGETHGAIGEYRGKDWGHHESSVQYKWNNICIPSRDKDLATTIDAIKKRAVVLFDFETNPHSELQKLYNAVNINVKKILFPTIQIQRLIDQFNEFVSVL